MEESRSQWVQYVICIKGWVMYFLFQAGQDIGYRMEEETTFYMKKGEESLLQKMPGDNEWKINACIII